jgi:hypothetical protein
MIIIVGNRTRKKDVGMGRFFCPNCDGIQTYRRKRIARYFTLYFVPVFPMRTPGEVLQCQGCLLNWQPEVLGRNLLSRDEPTGRSTSGKQSICTRCHSEYSSMLRSCPECGGKAGTGVITAVAKPKAPTSLRVDYSPVLGQESAPGGEPLVPMNGPPDPCENSGPSGVRHGSLWWNDRESGRHDSPNGVSR